MPRITEVQIAPIKPKDGLVAFASFVLDNSLYLGSVGIATRLQGGYRLIYPTKRTGNKDINVFHPINKAFAQAVEDEVVKHFEDVMNKSNDRHNRINPL
jgi:DNA-binding cell septation regulator SpoVG